MNGVLTALFLIPYFFWILFCFTLSLVGWLLPRKSRSIDLEKVLDRETICRVLFEKGKLSQEQYDFETQDVASSHDEPTFKGYMFIVVPVIPVLKHFQFLDGLLLWLVDRWIKAHHYFLGQSTEKNHFENAITHFCVWNAKNVGRLLLLKL